MKSSVALIVLSLILGSFYYAFPRTVVKETVRTVDKPVYVERVVEKPVIREKIVEKPVVKYVDRIVERTAYCPQVTQSVASRFESTQTDTLAVRNRTPIGGCNCHFEHSTRLYCPVHNRYH